MRACTHARTLCRGVGGFVLLQGVYLVVGEGRPSPPAPPTHSPLCTPTHSPAHLPAHPPTRPPARPQLDGMGSLVMGPPPRPDTGYRPLPLPLGGQPGMGMGMGPPQASRGLLACLLACRARTPCMRARVPRAPRARAGPWGLVACRGCTLWLHNWGDHGAGSPNSVQFCFFSIDLCKLTEMCLDERQQSQVFFI